jgi:UDP-galactopyranose mutase
MTGSDRPDVVCVSHLWWDWVWQRPQQLLSRLAARWPVFWVDEPRLQIGPAGDRFAVDEPLPGVRVARLVSRHDPPGFRRQLDEALDRSGARAFAVSDDIREAGLGFASPLQPRLEREVRAAVGTRRRGPVVLWLYTPAALPFLDLLRPDLVVYDVMDELSAFKFAPPGLAAQERELLARADLVFAGGPSLHAARRGRHPDLHLFPSGVDQAHFARALDDALPLPPEIRDLPRPVIGFFGVIDERLDRDLLARAAAARPEWSWVLIGPVLKIEERQLPRAPNIHYLGPRDYRDLPAFLKGFDVAILPFARSAATRFLSPTKTLEYMAAHKPIVSVGLPDVVALYGEVVRVADGSAAFVAAIEAALGEGPRERAARIDRERIVLGRYAWDRLAEEMAALIADRLARKRAALGPPRP